MQTENPPTGRRYSIGPASFEAPTVAPGLHLVATPIGHLADMTVRGLMTLAAAERVYCEDTRRTSKLLAHYGIKARLSPYHEHNAAKVRPGIIRLLKEGAALALVSDAGTPLVSDPGYRLVEECIAANVSVTVCPGASAVLASLALSGLPTDRFAFIGFLPAKAGERRRLIEEFATLKLTLVLFEGPHRIVETLQEIESLYPGRRVAVARELTKLHEEVLRGTASEVRQALASRAAVKGEITLLIAPPSEAEAPQAELVDRAILAALETMPAGRAAADVARNLGLDKKTVYARLLALKNDHG